MFQTFFPNIISKVKKSNFRYSCKRLSIENGQFLYKKRKIVVLREQQRNIIHDIFEHTSEFRDVLRTQLNICDRDFLRKLLKLKHINYFRKNAPS